MSYTKDQAEVYIDGQIVQSTDIVDTALTLYNTAMAELSVVLDSLSQLSDVAVPEEIDLAFNAREFEGTAPLYTAPVFDSFVPPVLLPYIEVPKIVGVSMPEAPDDILPVVDIPFMENLYYSSLLERFNTYLISGLTGGTGIPNEVEDAIYTRDRIRRELEATRLEDQVGVAFAARGFSRPPGAYAAAMAQVSRDKLLVAEDASRDVMIRRTEMEQTFNQLVSTAIPQIESMVIDYHDKAEGRRYDREKSVIENGLDVWKNTWQRYTSLMEAAKIEADLSIAQVTAAIETNRGIGDVNRVHLETTKLEVELETTQIEMEVKAFEAAVTAFQAELEAYKVTEDTQIRSYEAELKQEISNAEIAIKASDISMQALISLKSVLVEAAKGNASVSAQVLASALNSINTALSYGYSGSVSASYNNDETKRTAGGAQTINYHYFNETAP